MARRKRTRKRLGQVLPDLLNIVRYFSHDIGRKTGLILYSFAALMVGVVFKLLEPWPLKVLLDEIVVTNPDQGNGPHPSLFQSWTAAQLILAVAVAVIVIALVQAMAEYISRVGFFKVGNFVVIRIRDRVYRHLQALPLSFHDHARQGDLVTRVTRDVSLLRDTAATALLPLLGSTLVLVGMAGVMIWLNWKLALVAMTIMPLYWLSTVRIGRQIRARARKQREREGAMATIAAETIGSIRAIKALRLEEKFSAEFHQQNDRSQSDDLKANRLSLKLNRTVDILLAIATACALFLGAHYVVKGQMLIGDLLVFVIYLKRCFRPAQEFAKYTARIAKATAAGERVIELLELPIEPARQDKTPLTGIRGDIEFDNVTFGYGPDQLVLKDLCLRVPAGTTVAITGSSGIGKSTLLNLLLGFYTPQSGRILLDGHDFRDCSLSSWRSQFSVVLQDPLLFAGTIKDNIAIAHPDATDAAIVRAARLAEADEFVLQMPLLFETKIGERSMTISRGQKQRLAIARAALDNRPVLLLDEPTTGLDEANQELVVDALLELVHGKTALMVTHNLKMSARADLIAHVTDGRVTELGTHDELVKRDGKYAQLFRQQLLHPRAVDDAEREIEEKLLGKGFDG